MRWIWVVFAAGCASSGGIGEPCRGPADCADGFRCVSGRCDAEPDGHIDARPDATADTSTDAPTEMDARVDAPSDASDSATPSPCGSPCAIWTLADGAPAWQAFPAPSGAFAPTAPIRAAFDIESRGVAYVFTDGTYHVLDVGSRSYTSAGQRGDVIPELNGVPLVGALSIPAGHAGGDPNTEGLIVSGAAVAQTYDVDVSTRVFTSTNRVTDFGDAWMAPLAPPRTAIRAEWLALEDNEGWVGGSPRQTCGANLDTVDLYSAHIAASSIHFLDLQVCFEFVSQSGYGTFNPTARSGSPSIEQVAAAFYHQGTLWLFAE
ncbi:MAG: hypothetical protein AAGF12_22430 [Myxococcota bacterium]